MNKWSVITAILSAFCLWSCAQEVATPLFVCRKRLQNPYGVVSHFSHTTRDYPTQKEQIKLMKNAGIRNVRYDFWVPYNKDWSMQDNLQILDTATWNTYKSDISLLGIIFVGWTGQRAWDEKSYYHEFLDYLISRYKDIVPYWEVMNEVNLTSESDRISIDSTFKCYMNLLPDTYKKLKSANPKITVTSTGLGEIKDDFLELICKFDVFNYFDVLNFHTYDLPESFPGKFHKIRDLMDKYHWNKPVWITECGLPTQIDTSFQSGSISNAQKEQEQAYRLPRTYIISFAYGIDKVFTYNFRAKEINRYYTEDNFGILHADLSPKPAYYAYKTMTMMMPVGSTRPKLVRDGNFYYAQWMRPDGKKVYSFWNSKKKDLLKLDVKGKYTCFDIYGNTIKLEDDNLMVSPSIKYLVGRRSLKIKIKDQVL